MNNKILIPIVGIHSAGKSTIRHKLEQKGYITEEECAEILRVNDKLVAGAAADSSFEELVEKEEKKRDITRKWETQMVFIESWHILTLGYLLTRGVEERRIKYYFEYVEQKKKEYTIYCIFLKSDPRKILERSRKLHSEKDINDVIAFYSDLEKNIKYVLDKLKIKYKEFNTMKSIDETMEEITNYIETFE